MFGFLGRIFGQKEARRLAHQNKQLKSVSVSLASPKNRNRRKIAAFSNRKVENRSSTAKSQKVARTVQKSAETFFGPQNQNRSVSAFSKSQGLRDTISLRAQRLMKKVKDRPPGLIFQARLKISSEVSTKPLFFQESPRQTKPKKGPKRKVHQFHPFFCNPAGLLQESLGPFGPEVSPECPRECPRKWGVSEGVSDGGCPRGPSGPALRSVQKVSPECPQSVRDTFL